MKKLVSLYDFAMVYLKKQINLCLLICLALICWGRLLGLRGFWLDDWAWVWHYYNTDNLSEFLLPFRSLRHELDGCLLYLDLKFLDLDSLITFNIWGALRFLVFIINPLLLYLILRYVLDRKSILPKAIAVIYLVSPLINNLCVAESNRRVYLFIFILSILFTVRSLVQKSYKTILYLSAIFLSLFSMVGIESFVFTETVRPIIVFYILSKRSNCTFTANLKKTFLYWLPFIIVGAGILLRSIGFFSPRHGAYANVYNIEHKHLFRIICNYITSFRYLFVDHIIHFVRTLVFVERDFVMMLLSLIAAVFAVIIIFRKNKTTEVSPQTRDISKEAMLVALFGMFLMIVGLFPYIMTRGVPYFGGGSRRALEASIGASIFLPSVFFALYYKGLIKKWTCSLLLGSVIFLGVFQCNAAIRAYDNDWQQQRSFLWQFIWRVPDLKDNAYILVDMPREESEYFDVWRGFYEFSCPLNLAYAESKNEIKTNNYFTQSFDCSLFNPGFEELFYLNSMDKQTVDFESYRGLIKYYPQNLMVASYKNGNLYLNHEVNESNSSGKVNVEPLMSRISPDRIIYEQSNKTFPFRWIIGPEPPKAGEMTVMERVMDEVYGKKIVSKDWRFYWQSAKVLEYKEDYNGITALFDEAEKLNATPEFPNQVPLFIIKAFYMTGQIDKGNSLLKAWAFSVDSSREKAVALMKSIEATNNDPEVSLKIKKQIERIWGQAKLSEHK